MTCQRLERYLLQRPIFGGSGSVSRLHGLEQSAPITVGLWLRVHVTTNAECLTCRCAPNVSEVHHALCMSLRAEPRSRQLDHIVSRAAGYTQPYKQTVCSVVFKVHIDEHLVVIFYVDLAVAISVVSRYRYQCTCSITIANAIIVAILLEFY